ncbi:MAG: ribose-phosphate diphosphokinase, partial [Coriobacteriales bacterium]|nr:ribose-phosphate diphosphokinase [Coriobacteriales bacterium]
MYENLSKPLVVEKEIKLYSGTGNPELARRIAQILHLELSGLTVEKFANGETYAKFDESIRGDEVFIIQSIAGQNINDLLMELLVAGDAAKRASVGTLTAVIPHYAYARQDRKSDSREPITARLVANLLECAGYDRLITLDLHQGQIQGFFDVPVTHLTALYLLGDYFMAKNFDWDNTVVVSPDMGRAKAAKKLADHLGCSVAIAHKSRPKHNEAEVMGIIGDIEGKTCIINDDMIDTAGTLCGSLAKLKEMGAGDIYVCATHGLFT